MACGDGWMDGWMITKGRRLREYRTILRCISRLPTVFVVNDGSEVS